MQTEINCKDKKFFEPHYTAEVTSDVRTSWKYSACWQTEKLPEAINRIFFALFVTRFAELILTLNDTVERFTSLKA